jgi:hypothetical protein
VGTVPMYRTHRTHYTYPVSNRSSNRSFKLKNMFLFNKLLINFKDIKKSLARSAANWVRMVGTVGTVHVYDGYGGTVDEYRTWVRWHGTWARYMGTVHGYGAGTQTYTQHPYPHPTAAYPRPIPVTVPNNTQHPYP